jgi:hypothetical protein
MTAHWHRRAYSLSLLWLLFLFVHVTGDTFLGHSFTVLRWHVLYTGPAGAGEHIRLGMFMPLFVRSPAAEKNVTGRAELTGWRYQIVLKVGVMPVAR